MYGVRSTEHGASALHQNQLSLCGKLPSTEQVMHFLTLRSTLYIVQKIKEKKICGTYLAYILVQYLYLA